MVGGATTPIRVFDSNSPSFRLDQSGNLSSLDGVFKGVNELESNVKLNGTCRENIHTNCQHVESDITPHFTLQEYRILQNFAVIKTWPID